MKEVPPLDQLNFLIGLHVSNVIFQPFSIDIGFDGGTFLVCEHELEHYGPDGVSGRINIQNGFGAVALHKIVGCQVAKIERASFSFELYFDDKQLGACLRIQ
jgi:hypothetical protein